jgi:hypothetical protein
MLNFTVVMDMMVRSEDVVMSGISINSSTSTAEPSPVE